ncbi:MAG: GNAT family N-acetyltransferase, partial [Candidatus Bathyarchaeota archaeon]|nr:GNAT family N-acetyltransferase [Candidatus Bathyarchaeota archaeon]
MSSTFLDPQTPKRISVDLHGRKREIELRLAKPEDALDMVNFFNSYYGHRYKRTPADWIWQYYTYEPDLAPFAFAKDGDKVIGTEGIMPIYMEVSGRRVLTGKIENILVLAPYRRTGVMARLGQFVLERALQKGGEFGWGFTPVEKILKKYELSAYHDMQIWMRPGNIWVAVVSNLKNNEHLGRRIRSLAKLFMKHLSSGKIPEIQIRQGYEIRQGLCDAHDIQELYERLKVKYQHLVFFIYDQKYLQWRIRGHPFLKYDEYQVYQGDEMRAYEFVVLSSGTLYIS